jgi:hypothetical protein
MHELIGCRCFNATLTSEPSRKGRNCVNAPRWLMQSDAANDLEVVIVLQR